MVGTSNRLKMKEDIVQLKVCVPIRDLWKAMSSDLRHIVAKVLPDMVEEVEMLEGDGGLGSILLFKFFPHVPKLNFQRRRLWSMMNHYIRSLLKYWKEGIWIMGLQDIQMFLS
ncbi:unnamed protein product [Lactuca virosa]|uniref:Uncharacterized protein n=1 Tax=Lactuca virosa TaxID=75947 RepID=A0AAU9MPZ3_9ASTR|nr:unnamed protein product [Lactuca virosa]